MKKFTKTQIDTAIKNAVKSILVDGADINNTVENLYKDNYIDFKMAQAFEPVITRVGLKEGFILSDADVVNKVKSFLKGKTVSHYLDVVTLAKELPLAQLTQIEREAKIAVYSGTDASLLKRSSKFDQFTSESKIHGRIAQYIRENPDYTPSQLIKAGKDMGESSATKTDNYVNEFLAYREFFANL